MRCCCCWPCYLFRLLPCQGKAGAQKKKHFADCNLNGLSRAQFLTVGLVSFYYFCFSLSVSLRLSGYLSSLLYRSYCHNYRQPNVSIVNFLQHFFLSARVASVAHTKCEFLPFWSLEPSKNRDCCANKSCWNHETVNDARSGKKTASRTIRLPLATAETAK